MRVGLLALQGDYSKHREKFVELGVESAEVRTARDLTIVDRLVIPGGESTTMTKVMSVELREALQEFGKRSAVWGTCAGMVMLSKDSADQRVRPLGWMDVDVDRNGFGRQLNSFEADLRVSSDLEDHAIPLHGIFIRAPRIRRLGNEVRVLAWHGEEPVCVRQGRWMASSFHPELTPDSRLHRYFLSLS